MILSHSMLLGVNKQSYMDAVIADGAAYAWDFHDQPAGTSTAIAGGVPMQMVNGIVSATAFDDVAKSVKLNGTNQYFWANSAIFPDVGVSLEFLIRSSASSGNIFGTVSTTPPSSTAHDKHIFFDTSGKLAFGVWNTAAYTKSTGINISDNKLHHIAFILSSGNVRLILDGTNIFDLSGGASSAVNSPAFAFKTISAWSGMADGYLSAEIACPAIYNFVMTPQMANIHYMLSKQ